MICYELVCAAQHRFEGFFPSAGAFSAQQADGRLSCPSCGSLAVQKVPYAKGAAPRSSAPQTAPAPAGRRFWTARSLRSFIMGTAEELGRGFAAEARAIAEGQAAPRPIRGSCSPEEAEALADDGIPVLAIPEAEPEH